MKKTAVLSSDQTKPAWCALIPGCNASQIEQISSGSRGLVPMADKVFTGDLSLSFV